MTDHAPDALDPDVVREVEEAFREDGFALSVAGPAEYAAVEPLSAGPTDSGSEETRGCRLRGRHPVRTFPERKANDWLDFVGHQ